MQQVAGGPLEVGAVAESDIGRSKALVKARGWHSPVTSSDEHDSQRPAVCEGARADEPSREKAMASKTASCSSADRN